MGEDKVALAECYARIIDADVVEVTEEGVKLNDGSSRLHYRTHAYIQGFLDRTKSLAEGNYKELSGVFNKALEQASYGKGKERHANNLPFEKQRMQTLTDAFGLGFTLGQAAKKCAEAKGMAARDDLQAAKFELLGALNYIAGAYIHIDNNGGSNG